MSNFNHFCPHCKNSIPEQPECSFCRVQKPRAGWPKDKLIDKILKDKYRLIRRLGAGGFGVVYLATHTDFKGERAVKILHEQFTYEDRVVARFFREAKAIYNLNGPNIVKLEDYGELPSGQPFMVMEFAAGDDLGEILEREHTLEIRRSLSIVRQVAIALVEASREGILHRDLKPENIIVNKTQYRGEEVKVLDFGIAKILNDPSTSLTGTNMIIGTPEFMSPEQWEKKDSIDSRADIYSLGVILFNCLTGLLPFPAQNQDPLSVYLQILKNPVPTLSEVQPEISWPKSLEFFLAQVLSKEPEKRPSSPQEFIEKLDQLLLTLDSTDGLPNVPTPSPAPRELEDTIPAQKLKITPTASATSKSATSAELVAALRDPYSRRMLGLLGLIIIVLVGVVLLIVNTVSTDSSTTPDSETTPTLTQESTITKEVPDVDDQEEVQSVAEPDVTDLLSAEKSEVATLDPNLPKAPEGMVYIAGGTAKLGATKKQHKEELKYYKSHGCDSASLAVSTTSEKELKPFFVDKYEVSNRMLATFMRSDSYPDAIAGLTELCPDLDFGRQPIDNDLPAVNISYYEAAYYCRFAGKQLPTEEQWEFALRGPEGQLYPWGSTWDPTLINHGALKSCPPKLVSDSSDGHKDAAPVISYPQGCTRDGVCNLLGNVSEWVNSPRGTKTISHRGGSFKTGETTLKGYTSEKLNTTCHQSDRIGLRCAKEYKKNE